MNQRREILQELLVIERERLATAVKIERERKIVFPETSVIIHDIMKLAGIVYAKSEEDTQGAAPEKADGKAAKVHRRGQAPVFD